MSKLKVNILKFKLIHVTRNWRKNETEWRKEKGKMPYLHMGVDGAQRIIKKINLEDKGVDRP